MFGFARGCTVLLTAPLRTQSDIYAFHRRFAASGELVRRAVIVAQLAVAVVAAWVAASTLVAVSVTAGALALAVWTFSRGLAESSRARVAARPVASEL